MYEIVSDPLLVLYEVDDGTGDDTGDTGVTYDGVDGVETYETVLPCELVPDTLVYVPPFLVVETDSVKSEVPP
jgi:hypothetical protein